MTFASTSTNLAPKDINGSKSDVFVHDMLSGVTALVSVDIAGQFSGNGDSLYPSISDDGRCIAFRSASDNLTAVAPVETPGVFVRDVQLRRTAKVAQYSPTRSVRRTKD